MDGTTTIVASGVGLIALAYSLVNYLRYLANITVKDSRDKFVSQTIAYIVFIAVVFLAGASAQFGGVEFLEGTKLIDMDAGGKALLGLMLGGGGSVLVNTVKAIDNTDSAAQPPFTK